MKRQILLSVFIVLFVSPFLFAADTYVIDPGHTRVGFSVRHLVISKISGMFKEFSGTILFDENDVTNSEVSGTIKTASLDSNNANRDSDLRGESLLDVEKYPEITFQSKKIAKKGDGYLVTGTLTIKGVSKDIELPAELSGPVKVWGGQQRIGMEASATIERKDFNILYSKLVEGVQIVGDEVEIHIDAEAVKQ